MTDWQEARAEKFPKNVLSAAQAAERATGIPACITLAQWAWESAYGKVTAGDFNYFGMKWAPAWGLPFKLIKTWEEINGKQVVVYDKFLSFKSFDQAFIAHGQLLADPKGPYAFAYVSKGDWEKYMRKIGPVYATDHHYADSLVDLIKSFHLYDYNLPHK